MTKLEAMNAIPRLLDQCWHEGDYDFAISGRGKLLDEALTVFGCPPAGYPYDEPKDYGYACTLVAALDYFWDGANDLSTFEDALKKASACVESNKCRHYVDADDYECVGYDYYFHACGRNVRLPQLIIDHLDVEALGEDVAKQEHGKLTRYGYFAPEQYNG